MARILLIDDEHNIRMMVQLALQHVGHAVTTGSDGPEGLSLYGEGGDWDLVLLDQRMPEMEGLEVLQEIRRRNPLARVIMITAFGTIDLAVEAMKLGATDFLRKPFTTDVLRGAVQAVLREETSESGTAGPAITYSMTTINGYRIDMRPGTGVRIGSDLHYPFTIRSPAGEQRSCVVELSGVVIELTRAHADREKLPGGDRFWQALCEEALANYLWQNAEYPQDDRLRVDDLSASLRRWINAVLAQEH